MREQGIFGVSRKLKLECIRKSILEIFIFTFFILNAYKTATTLFLDYIERDIIETVVSVIFRYLSEAVHSADIADRYENPKVSSFEFCFVSFEELEYQSLTNTFFMVMDRECIEK